MIIGINFDGTVVVQDGRDFADVTSPLQFCPGADEGLRWLKRANHHLLLFSSRANRSLREDPYYDPMVRMGVRKVDRRVWESARALHEARFRQMIEFVNDHLLGVMDAIDDGQQGYPDVDLLISDNALRYGSSARQRSVDWKMVAHEYGEPPPKT